MFVASLFVILAGLRAASAVLAPLCVALFLSGIMLAPYEWLHRRGVRPLFAVSLTVLGGLALLGGLAALIVRWHEILSGRWPEMQARFAEIYTWSGTVLEGMGLSLDEGLSMGGGLDLETLSTMGSSAFRVVLVTGSVLLLTGFVLSDLVALPEKIGDDLRKRPRVARLLAGTAERMLVYFRVKSATSAATGVLAGLACFIVGLDLPLMWGVLAFLLNYITTVGSFIAATPPIILGFATLNLPYAVGLGLAYLVINVVIGGVVEPKLLGGSMNLSPLVILLSLALWGWVLGPIGVLLAVPFTTLLKILFEQTEHLRPVALVLGSRRSARRIRSRSRKRSRRASDSADSSEDLAEDPSGERDRAGDEPESSDDGLDDRDDLSTEASFAGVPPASEDDRAAVDRIRASSERSSAS